MVPAGKQRGEAEFGKVKRFIVLLPESQMHWRTSREWEDRSARGLSRDATPAELAGLALVVRT